MNRPLIDFVHPGDIPVLNEARKKVKFKKENVDGLELRFRRKDGSYTTLLWSSNVDRDSDLLYCIAKDVTQQKKDEARLRESEKLLREAQETAKIGSWIIYLEANEVKWSSETYKIFGVGPDYVPVIGKPRAFVDKESLPKYEKIWQTGVGSDTAFDEIIGLNAGDGKHKWVRIIGKTYYEEGKGRGYKGSIQGYY